MTKQAFSLSDPNHDFDFMEDILQAIVAKQGKGLTGDDLRYVFNGYLPAGTYAEVSRYLPALYQHLEHAAPDDFGCDLWENLIVIWIPQHMQQLQQDGSLPRVLEKANHLLQTRLKRYTNHGCVEDYYLLDDWCRLYLLSALFADHHAALLTQLQNEGVYGRMLLLTQHPILRLDHSPCIPDSDKQFFISQAEVDALIESYIPMQHIRRYIAQLTEEILLLEEQQAIDTKLFERWSDCLQEADDATAHLPGGPAAAT